MIQQTILSGKLREMACAAMNMVMTGADVTGK
jgi:hypothetical protein